MIRLDLALCFVATACSGTPRRAPTDPAAAPLVHTTYTIGGDAPTSLLVALHYSSGTPVMWHELVKDWDVPLRVVFPQGPFAHHREGYTWFPADHERKDQPGKLADVERAAARVASLIRTELHAHPEIRRVAVTGFSYGGDIAWLLAIRYPDLVDVAVPMGSRLLGDPTSPLPAASRIRVLQGETDAIVAAPITALRVDQLAARGVPIEMTLYSGLGHDLSPALLGDWRAFLQRELE